MADREKELSNTVIRLITAVQGLSNNLAALTERVRKNRTNLYLLAGSVALDLLLSIGLIYSLHNTNTAQSDANTAIVSVCESRNVSATKQHELWDRALALPSTTPRSEETIAAFQQILNETFPQQDCTDLVRRK